MNKTHKRRLWILSFFAIGTVIVCSLILYALKQNINVFLTPTELTSQKVGPYPVRLGGMVKKDSVVRENQGLGVSFIVTDYNSEIMVHYIGVLPDLFREGKGVITEGRLNTNHTFIATRVLAKHDENYMPKKITNALPEGKPA